MSPPSVFASSANKNDYGYQVCLDHIESLKKEGIDYPYYVIFLVGDFYSVVYTPEPVYFTGDVMRYVGDFYYIGSCGQYKGSLTGGRADIHGSEIGLFNKAFPNSLLLTSTYNIKNEKGEVVFRKPIVPGEMAVALPVTVISQMRIILVTAVGLMALLIGCLVLLPRLLRLFVRS